MERRIILRGPNCIVLIESDNQYATGEFVNWILRSERCSDWELNMFIFDSTEDMKACQQKAFELNLLPVYYCPKS